ATLYPPERLLFLEPAQAHEPVSPAGGEVLSVPRRRHTPDHVMVPGFRPGQRVDHLCWLGLGGEAPSTDRPALVAAHELPVGQKGQATHVLEVALQFRRLAILTFIEGD